MKVVKTYEVVCNMNIKHLKKSAKTTLKKNYWHSVAVIFFISILAGNFTISSPNVELSQIPFLNSINSNIAKDVIESISKVKFEIFSYKPTRGILANIFNNVTASGSFIFGILNSLNQLIFHERLWASFIIMIGAILTFLYWLIIRNTLLVGQNRFFLENKNHSKTHFKRIFLPFKIKKWKNISLAMMRKSLIEWLWWITIVGGIIKHYAYAMVPYILAENPGIKGKEAMKLSENMMTGYKWDLFKLDLSFLLWDIINIFSFNLLQIIFISPYKKCAMIEFYIQVRANAKEKTIANSDLLCDDYILEISDTYPKEKFMYEESKKKSWINTNYMKDYSINSIMLMFFSASMIGWIWEVLFHLFQFGSFVNRGTLHGPWLPIYGWGAITLLVILKKFRKNPILTFFLSMLICGLIEYGTGLYLEFFKNLRYWDYDGYFLNIHGRICLEGLIAFGLGGCAFIYFAAPTIESILVKINKKIKIMLCIILCFLFIGDNIYSNIHPNTGSGITQDLSIIVNNQNTEKA